MGGTGSGGARVRSGPPPDPNALRRNRADDAEWLTLPAEGRKGRAPKWPLKGQGEREIELWRELWRKPQAVAWEKLGLEHGVALLARRMVEAEAPLSSTSSGTLVKQMMDSLGLTVPGMRCNRWRIAEDELAAVRADRAARQPSSRHRLKVASGGGG